jgi:ketosteroid isomerase-like protein
MVDRDVELVRAVCEAFASRDIAAALELMDPDLEWVVDAALPESERTYRGHEGYRRWLAELEPWDQFLVTTEEIVEINEGHVVATLHVQERGRTSALGVDVRLYEVYTCRDGRIVKRQGFTDRGVAVEAAVSGRR